jgi:hypothetical protein
VCFVARNLRSDQRIRSHGAAELGRIDPRKESRFSFFRQAEANAPDPLENFVKGALAAPPPRRPAAEGPPGKEGANVPAHKSDVEGERSLSFSLPLSLTAHFTNSQKRESPSSSRFSLFPFRDAFLQRASRSRLSFV